MNVNNITDGISIEDIIDILPGDTFEVTVAIKRISNGNVSS